MANEIRGTVILQIDKGNFHKKLPGSTSQFTATLSSSTYTGTSGVFAVPTAAAGTAFDVSDLTANGGYFYAKNLDTTNYVEIGAQVGGTFYPIVRLNAGEATIFRVSDRTNFYGRANTAAVSLEYFTIDP